jgi:hypothetical protein
MVGESRFRKCAAKGRKRLAKRVREMEADEIRGGLGIVRGVAKRPDPLENGRTEEGAFLDQRDKERKGRRVDGDAFDERKQSVEIGDALEDSNNAFAKRGRDGETGKLFGFLPKPREEGRLDYFVPRLDRKKIANQAKDLESLAVLDKLVHERGVTKLTQDSVVAI